MLSVPACDEAAWFSYRQAVTGRGHRERLDRDPRTLHRGEQSGVARPFEPVLTAQSSPESLCQGFRKVPDAVPGIHDIQGKSEGSKRENP